MLLGTVKERKRKKEKKIKEKETKWEPPKHSSTPN